MWVIPLLAGVLLWGIFTEALPYWFHFLVAALVILGLALLMEAVIEGGISKWWYRQPPTYIETLWGIKKVIRRANREAAVVLREIRRQQEYQASLPERQAALEAIVRRYRSSR